jgi:hypothetical protein
MLAPETSPPPPVRTVPAGQTAFAATWVLSRLASAARREPDAVPVGQGTVRRMTQFPGPLVRTNVKPARSKRVRVPL